MFLGKVVGNVWSTIKDESLVGAKFLIVKQVDLNLKEKDNYVIAVDNLGAGVGELVLVTTGGSSEQTEFTKNKPVDAVIIAIVDNFDMPLKKYLHDQENLA